MGGGVCLVWFVGCGCGLRWRCVGVVVVVCCCCCAAVCCIVFVVL